MEALSNDFRAGLPWELLYADDLTLIAECQYVAWKRGMEAKGLCVNVKKTIKVFVSSRDHEPKKTKLASFLALCAVRGSAATRSCAPPVNIGSTTTVV